MKIKLIIPLFILTVFLIACSSEEKTINSPIDNWRLLVSTESPESLVLYQQPQGLISISDVYFNSNNKQLDGKVERIAENQKYLYLFIPSKFKIEVISNTTFKTETVLDYSAEGRIPSGICFPNPTDAYICFKNDSIIDLLDITNFKTARKITVGKNPVNIAVAGNQIFVVNSGDNTVSIINSNTHDVKTTLQVANKPYYVDVSFDKETAVVVSIGGGKTDTGTAKSAAIASVISVANSNVVKTVNIGTNSSDALNQIPRGISSTEKSWAFIPTKTNLFRINTKTGDLTSVGKSDYYSAFYNKKRDELIVIRKKGDNFEYYTADPSSAALRNSIKIPANYLTMMPLAD